MSVRLDRTRIAAAFVLALAWVLVSAAPVLADAAGPTNYLSTIVEIEPEVAGIEAEIIGGDSFLLLTVDGSALVEVIGYRGEPYLRFLPGGVVEQNDRSPTRYLNEDRYAVVELPASASEDAEPDWQEVATDGSYAWHDHRAHWMNQMPPPGRGPGDTILEGVVPILVDGVEVDLSVISVWQPEPSFFPVAAGAAFGLLLVVAVVVRPQPRRASFAGASLAVAALIVGGVAFLSVPPETVPEWTLWVAPALSLLLALVAAWPAVLGPGRELAERNRTTFTFVAAIALVAWAVVRWDWMFLAILPTNGPFWLDRLVNAAALVGGAGVAVAALRSVLAGPNLQSQGASSRTSTSTV